LERYVFNVWMFDIIKMFDVFKKGKKEKTLDLTLEGKDGGKEEIPIPSEMKTRLQAQAQEIANGQESVNVEPEKKPAESDSGSGGFFGGFFGGGENNSGVNSSTTSSTSSSVGTYNTSEDSDTKRKIDRISSQLTRLEQRIELLERKLDIRGG